MTPIGCTVANIDTSPIPLRGESSTRLRVLHWCNPSRLWALPESRHRTWLTNAHLSWTTLSGYSHINIINSHSNLQIDQTKLYRRTMTTSNCTLMNDDVAARQRNQNDTWLHVRHHVTPREATPCVFSAPAHLMLLARGPGGPLICPEFLRREERLVEVT